MFEIQKKKQFLLWKVKWLKKKITMKDDGYSESDNTFFPNINLKKKKQDVQTIKNITQTYWF